MSTAELVMRLFLVVGDVDRAIDKQTQPEARGQGIGSALLKALVQDFHTQSSSNTQVIENISMSVCCLLCASLCPDHTVISLAANINWCPPPPSILLLWLRLHSPFVHLVLVSYIY